MISLEEIVLKQPESNGADIMKKLICWEVVVTALTIMVYAVCLHFGLRPSEAAFVAFIIAFAAGAFTAGASTAFAAVAFVAAAVAVAFAVFMVAFAVGFAVFAAAVAAAFVYDVYDPKLKYRWVHLSLITEAAVIWLAMSHLFG